MRKVLVAFIIALFFAAAVFVGYFRWAVHFREKADSSLSNTLCNFDEGIDYKRYKDAKAKWEPNNKFGLYIYAESEDFMELAQKLVNSNGGEWGYVLIPFNLRNRDDEKWIKVFDRLNSKKLIPVIQLWDLDYSDYERDTKRAAEFLDKFVWPIKERYVAIYNEPPSNKEHMDAFEYMKEMDREIPGVFNKLDGWATHSYPQPNFSGNPHTVGRWSIKAYDTELDFLYEVLNVDHDLPVFITETGWAHAEGEEYNNSFLPVDQVADYFKQAYTQVWLPDDRVRAVMPFTVWYSKPFDHFAWVTADKVPYAHYNAVKSLKKIKGDPPSLVTNSIMINVCNVIN
jgi:hypothetical protein